MSEYLRLLQLSTCDLGYLGMEAIPQKMSYLTPSLTLVEEVPEDTKKLEGISNLLKQRANSTAASPMTYKMYLRCFNKGTVEQWIMLRGKLTKIWTQNAVTGTTDQLAAIHPTWQEFNLFKRLHRRKQFLCECTGSDNRHCVNYRRGSCWASCRS